VRRFIAAFPPIRVGILRWRESGDESSHSKESVATTHLPSEWPTLA
jgi:hypothetical protein